LACAVAAAVVGLLSIDDPLMSRAAAVAGACLVLWLSEAVPLFATTLVLWVATVFVLAPLDPAAFGAARVLSSATNPVMVLFFGGFLLSIAGAKYGIDAYIARWMIRASGGRRRALLATVMGVTACLSMWMLNTAAATMMVATLGPLLRGGGDGEVGEGDGAGRSFRVALLLGLALGANFGGIATPIGTGPNLIAIGAVAPVHTITFLDWMSFALPLSVAMLAGAYVLLVWIHRVSGTLRPVPVPHRPLGRRGWFVVGVFFATVAAWLLEPAHGVPAAVVALAMAATLFATNLLDARDLREVGWDTLLLIAGGLSLGHLFEASGLASAMAALVDWAALPHTVLLFGLVLACASLSSVASNTAAAAILIQLALGVSPSSPAVAILVALGASMGAPFVISTPPNAIAYGQGGLRSRDFLVPGLMLMAAGCVALVVGGPVVLRWLGIG
jgi:sodium-dependent dicarboxylate transporter 2/3/5